MDDAESRPTALAEWRREASPFYQVVFALGLLVLGGSFAAGLVEGGRLFGLPPVDGDVTALGQVLFERGDYAPALEEFRLAALIDPENFGEPPQLAFPRPPGGTDALVRRLRDRVRERQEDAAAHFGLGRALLLGGAVGEGLHSLERARDLDPQLPGLYGFLGRAYMEAGMLPESQRALREAVAADPSRPALWEVLAMASYRLGQPEQAAAQFERARALRERRGGRSP